MKKILSHFIPIKLRTYQSPLNGPLEITYLNGKKVLDTRHSNFSYGSLQRVLHKGLTALPFDRNTHSILLLGLGGGSVVSTIRNVFASMAEITAVEFDPEVIRIAEKEFHIAEGGGLNIVHSDALDYMEQNSRIFDLVIVDLFIEDTVPEVFTRKPFLSQLSGALKSGGKLLFNTMSRSTDKDIRNRMVAHFEGENLKIRVLPWVEQTNTLILGEKY